ncbi:hypothetical protein [Pseudoalteromonas sp. PS5]|uniref:hypothetical protein n=1 Tax=Pseudoalteromonas sp. PS5 TaxID=1437473 RepID=UPI000FFEF5EA|nr:hypothetical protein [Pseudoalteromonas sp. PS5]
MMIFITILAFTALLIAGNAAYFSILGLAAMFSASYWPVVFMGASLELGKLVAASYVYRAWDDVSRAMKGYLVSAILVLMAITSLGIFGFLSQGYGDSLKQLNEIELLVEQKQIELAIVREDIERIHTEIGNVPNTYVTKRIELQRERRPELEVLAEREGRLIEVLTQLNKRILEAKSHVGPILYVADMFNIDKDEAVKYFIFAIIIVFDPLAVILTLATNGALAQKQNESKHKKSEREQNEVQQSITSEPTTSDPSTKTVNEQIAPVSQKRAPDIPTQVRQMAKQQAPSIQQMDAALAQAQGKSGSLQINNQTKEQPNLTSIQRNDKDIVVLGGAKVHKAVIEDMELSDQEVIMGLVQGVSVGALASRLGLNESAFKSRANHLVDRLKSSGYQINTDHLFV